MNRIYRLSLPSWATAQREEYYAQMAQRGLFVSRCGNFFTRFERGVPQHRLYRLDAAPNRNEEPPQEQRQLYESCGWRFVCKSDWFNLYSAEPGTRELHTDPEWQSNTLKPMRRSLCMALISKGLYAVFLLFIFLVNSNSFMRDLSFLDIVYLTVMQFGWLIPLYFLLLLLQMGTLAGAWIHFSRYMRHLRTGKPTTAVSLNTFVIRHHMLSVLNAVLTVVLIAALLSLLPHTVPMGSSTEHRHFIQLQQLEPKLELSVEEYENSTVDMTISPVASFQMDNHQSDQTDTTHSWMFQHYVELKGPLSPKAVAQAMAKHTFLYDAHPMIASDLPMGIDYACIGGRSTEFVELCVVRANRILMIQYWGNATADDVISLASEALSA